MRNDQKKVDKLRKELINHQLAPHGVEYNDVLHNENWFNEYTTTVEEQENFRQYIIDSLRTRLRMSKKMAEKEAGWFLLQWGLRVPAEEYQIANSKEEV